MKCVKHLSVALAEFLHFMLLTHLQELSHSVDARFIGLWRQCIIDACLQIGFAGFCRQSFGDKYYVYAWKPLVEAGDVKAILFCVGLLVRMDVLYRSRMPSMILAALRAPETVTNMPLVTLLRWSMTVWLFPM